MTVTYLADPRTRHWAFQEQRIRAVLAVPSTRSACVEPLTETQKEARYFSAAKASHMRAAALRQPGQPGTSAQHRRARLETHRQLALALRLES